MRKKRNNPAFFLAHEMKPKKGLRKKRMGTVWPLTPWDIPIRHFPMPLSDRITWSSRVKWREEERARDRHYAELGLV